MIRAEAFITAAREHGFAWYGGVPCSFFTPLINAVIEAPELSYVSAPNEGDAVAAAAGVALGGRQGVAMMQNSGLGNAINPLTSLAWPFRLPLLLIVTWRGAPDVDDEPQHRLMGAITPGLLESMEIPWEAFPMQAADITPALARATEHMAATGRPYALIMRKGAVAPHPLTGKRRRLFPERAAAPKPDPWREPVLRRAEALSALIERTPPADTVLIASTGYTGRELYALADRPNHLYMVGSMGCASALGLGLAMVRPDLRVVVVDGDGAALMRLGNFAVVATYGASNLVHLLLDNGMHESTGGQDTLSPGVSFAAIAAACGYAAVFAGQSTDVIDRALHARGRGPVFAHLRIRPGTPTDLPRPALDPQAVKERLMAHIGDPP